MSFSLIVEDTFYKRETTFTDSYVLDGVYHQGEETVDYKSISGTLEPYRDGEEAVVLPAGVSSSDSRILYSSEPLQTYDDTGEVGLADIVYIKNPDVSRSKPQGYVVMGKEDWSTNSGFTLISTDDAVTYLLVKKEKALDHGS